MMYVPSYLHIKSRLKSDPASDDEYVKVPLKLVKTLLQAAAACEAFNEETYIQEYKDVAQAVNEKVFTSGRHHYLTVGYFEGRRNPSIPFDDLWYEDRYQDVQLELTSGFVSSLLDHYVRFGFSRGYAPNQSAFEALQRWERVMG